MFVQDFVMLDRPYEEVAAELRQRSETVVRSALAAARAHGRHLQGRVGPATWPVALATVVEVRSRPVRVSTDGLVLGFDWEPAATPSLLHRLEGDLVVAPFGAADTQLSLRCRYQPPSGLASRRADELLMHRVVESTLRAFLHGVCAALA